MSKLWDVNVLNSCDIYFGSLIFYSNSLNCKKEKWKEKERSFYKGKPVLYLSRDLSSIQQMQKFLTILKCILFLFYFIS